MPDFSKCVKHKGKIFCWDTQGERIVEIVQNPVSISDCPEIVILEIMRELGREAKRE